MVLIVALVSMTAMAQTDVLGAHNVYGRGCVACHAPHSGANGGMGTGTTTDSQTGILALWGQNLSPLYGQTVSFGDAGKYTVTLPTQGTLNTLTAGSYQFVIIACLSCHDGNLAKVGMMTGQTVETLPIVGTHAPTLLGNDGSTAGNYNNDHPVGPVATIGCGGQYNWDCTISGTGQIQMTGPASSVFYNTDYGFTVSPTVINTNVPIVTCTTCHDQHSEIIWSGTIAGKAALYNTSFFVRGPYTPTTGGATVSNAAAQFCRNCHGGESNEMHGLTVPTTGITSIPAL
jgi:hypothetical protein